MLYQPTLRVIKGEEGALLLAPVRRPCCLELLCYQESLFSRVVWRPDRTRVGAISRGSTMTASDPTSVKRGFF